MCEHGEKRSMLRRRCIRIHSLLCYCGLLLLLLKNLKVLQADPHLLDGPSIVALKYRDGIVVASDARSPGSTYQPHHWPDAIRPLTSHILMGLSGSNRAALQQHVLQLEQQLRDDAAPHRTVCQLAHALRALQQDESNNGSGEILLVGMEEGTEAKIFILNHGALLKETRPFAVVGRESAYLAGCLEHFCREDALEEEAVEICRQALQRLSHGPIHMYILSRHQPLRHCIIRPISSTTEPLAPSV